MIKKETFVDVMNKLKNLDEKMGNVDDAFKELCPDFCGFYMPEPLDMIVELLEEIFYDKENHWLSYFIWERNYLEDFELGDVVVDGKAVDLDTWGKVYDFLIDNMQYE